MAAIGHQSEKPSSSGGSSPAENVIACAVCSCQRALVPQLELVALPDQHHAMVEARVLAQRRGHEDAAGAVHARRRRRDRRAGAAGGGSRSLNDDSAMRRAWIGSHASARVQEQAAAGVDGEDERALPPASGVGSMDADCERVAVFRGNRQPALGVEGEMRHAPKYRATGRRTRRSLRHRAPSSPRGKVSAHSRCREPAPSALTFTHFYPLLTTLANYKGTAGTRSTIFRCSIKDLAEMLQNIFSYYKQILIVKIESKVRRMDRFALRRIVRSFDSTVSTASKPHRS